MCVCCRYVLHVYVGMCVCANACMYVRVGACECVCVGHILGGCPCKVLSIVKSYMGLTDLSEHVPMYINTSYRHFL